MALRPVAPAVPAVPPVVRRRRPVHVSRHGRLPARQTSSSSSTGRAWLSAWRGAVPVPGPAGSWRSPGACRRRSRYGTARASGCCAGCCAATCPRTCTSGRSTGFDVPVGAWLRGPLRDWAEDLLDEDPAAAGGPAGPGRRSRARWRAHLGGPVRSWLRIVGGPDGAGMARRRAGARPGDAGSGSGGGPERRGSWLTRLRAGG